MIRIALCDDEANQLRTTEALIRNNSQNTPPCTISTFSSGAALLDAVIMNGPFDVYVLDVVMPQMSGIETGVALRKYDEIGKIIYLTSSPDFGVDSYIANAFYYLLKPVDPVKFSEVLGKAIAEISRRKEKAVKVKTADEVRLLSLDEILYVELCKKALVYHLADGTDVTSLSTREGFSTLVTPLTDDSRFSLCGSALCVNLFFVKSVEKECILLKNGTKIFPPKKACLALRSAWIDYWFGDEDGEGTDEGGTQA